MGVRVIRKRFEARIIKPSAEVSSSTMSKMVSSQGQVIFFALFVVRYWVDEQQVETLIFKLDL